MSLSLALGLGEAAADVVALPFAFFVLPEVVKPFSFAITFFDWFGKAEVTEVEVCVFELVDWLGGLGSVGSVAEAFGLESMTTEGASLFTVGEDGREVRLSSRYLACCC